MAATDTIGMQGVVPLRIDTPFLVGAVNLWLIEDEPLTLVDTGTNTGTALLQLRELLGARGHRLQDVGRIVVSHQHLDHVGLAGPLAALTGAEVVAAPGMDAHLAPGASAALAEERFNRELMAAHGVPADTTSGWWSARPDAMGFASPVADVRTVDDGDVLPFAGRTLHVHHRPGHSPSDLVLEDRERGALIVGDHLLAGAPPVPMLHPPLPGGPAMLPDPSPGGFGRASALLTLRDSMRRTAALGARVALTGHGHPVPDVAANVAARLAAHDDAAEVLLAALRAGGPGTAYELARRTAAGRRVHPYFGLCTTLGTLDHLVDEGRAAAVPGDGPARWTAR